MKASSNHLPFNQKRYIAWFSCGAASAVAAKRAVEKYGDLVTVAHCDTLKTEHPDNRRFFNDVQDWLGVPITQLRSELYTDIDDVFEKTRYMSGADGARCTTEMKKVPRFNFQWIEDVHIFGFTFDEKRRIADFKKHNPELEVEWILVDEQITKDDCFQILSDAGIKRSAMYELGFEHSNCLGCVKSQSPGYWNRTRKYFPSIFKRRCEQSRKLGVTLVKYKGERIFLDELPEGVGFDEPDDSIECGVVCQSN